MSEEFLLKFKVEVEDKEQLSEVFNGATGAAERYSSRLKSILAGTGSAISSFAGKASGELNAFAGKEVGASIGEQARGVLKLRDAIAALSVSSGNGNEIVGGLKDQIQATSKATNQLQGDVTEALSAFVERTGELETARRNIELYGKAATATGAAVKDLSLVGVELSDKLGIKDQAQAFAILATQSKAGAIELRDLATKGPRIFAAAASAGAKGESGLREAGALAQVYAKAFGGSGTAASVSTAIENTFADILKKSSKVEALGVKVGDRDRFEVLKDIIRETKGDEQQLLSIFGKQSIRGVNVLAREYLNTGGFGTFDTFRDVKPDAGVIDKDFATRNSSGEAALRRAQVSLQAWSDKWLGGIAEFAARHANEMQVTFTALGLTGKGLSLAGRVGGLLPGSVGDKIASATAARVYVTNWPNGGFGGAPPSGSSLPPAAPAALSTAGAVGGVAVPALALLGALAVHNELLDTPLTAESNSLIRKKNEDVKSGRLRETHGWGTVKSLFTSTPGYEANPTVQAPQVNITIHSNENLDIKSDDGTRAPKVMDKRGGGY